MSVKKKKTIIHLYTGEGAGKTTSVFGVALRCLGHGKRVVIIQFMKGWKNIGEYKIFTSNYEFLQKGNINSNVILNKGQNEIHFSSDLSDANNTKRADIRISLYDDEDGDNIPTNPGMVLSAANPRPLSLEGKESASNAEVAGNMNIENPFRKLAIARICQFGANI